jgi:hypothetical protein
MRRIETSFKRARQTEEAIRRKISDEALHLIKRAFLTSLKGRELAMLTFLQRGFKEGKGLLNRLSAPEVEPLLRAVRHLPTRRKVQGIYQIFRP